MPIEFKIRYDRYADALYIKFKDGKVVESDEIASGIIVDLDENNEIIGVEILWVSKRKLDLTKLLLEGPEALMATT